MQLLVFLGFCRITIVTQLRFPRWGTRGGIRGGTRGGDGGGDGRVLP